MTFSLHLTSPSKFNHPPPKPVPGKKMDENLSITFCVILLRTNTNKRTNEQAEMDRQID